MGPQEPHRQPSFASIIDSIVDIITIIGADGTIHYESPSIFPALGYTTDELIGKNVFSLVHPGDYARAFSMFITNLMNKGIVKKIEVRFKHKDGSWRHLECIGKNMLDDPQIRGFVLCSRDISERRKSEDQIHLQSKALEAASNGIVITDVQGTILWVNDAFTRMTGYKLEEAVGKNPRILKSGEQPKEAYAQMWKTIASGTPWTGEIINRRKDGSLYFERMTIAPVVEGGKTTHYIAIKEDISSDKKLEAQFRQAQKMEVVGQLVGGVAHDFNNILTVILGHAMILQSSPSLDAQLAESVEEIRRSGQRASALTKQLLAFSRKQILQLKVTDVNEIVRGADKMMRRLVGESIEFVTIFGEGLPKVKVDASQVEQILMNLAVNARDAMPHGGKLVIESSAVTVTGGEASHYPGFVPGPYVLLTVKDSGTGMSAEVKAHLFEPFFTTKEKGKGTGLGLATVYGIVKQLQGFIYADSQPGKGTTFKVYLPPSDVQETADAGGLAKAVMPVGNETILIAEDEDLVRGLVLQILTRQGFHVLEARNGLEAVSADEKHQGEPIRLLVTDMVMPYMGGSELAEKFSARHPGVPILFTSGYSDHGAVQKWLDKGHRFLQKPYTPIELLQLVRSTLDSNKV